MIAGHLRVTVHILLYHNVINGWNIALIVVKREDIRPVISKAMPMKILNARRLPLPE